MKVRKRTLFIFSGLLMSLGCGKQLSSQEYTTWIKNPENGMVKTVEAVGVSMECMYQPKPLVEKLLQESIDNDVAYFNIRLLFQEEPSSETKSYIFFDMEKDLFLVSSNDTLPCILFHAEPWNGVTPYQTCLTAFEFNATSNEDFKIIIQSPTGSNLEFDYSETDFKNIPTLKK